MKEDLFDFDFVDDSTPPEVQDAIQTAVQAVTPPEPQPPVTPPEPEVTPEAPKEPESELTGLSPAALLLDYFKTNLKGTLPEDLELKKDLSEEELTQLLDDLIIKKRAEDDEKRIQEREEAERQRLAEKGLTDEHLAYIQQIINGGDPQVVSRVAQFRSWATAELESDEDNEAMVRAAMRVQHGSSDEALRMIDSFIKNELKDSEALAAMAKEKQAWIGQVADSMAKQDELRVQNEKLLAQQQELEFAKDLEKQIKSGVYGLNFKKPEMKELLDYMTKKCVPVTLNGRRVEVTQEEADRLRDSKDIAKRIYEANARRIGYDKIVNTLVETANSTNVDKYVRAIRKTEEQAPTMIPSPNGVETWELEI